MLIRCSGKYIEICFSFKIIFPFPKGYGLKKRHIVCVLCSHSLKKKRKRKKKMQCQAMIRFSTVF